MYTDANRASLVSQAVSWWLERFEMELGWARNNVNVSVCFLMVRQILGCAVRALGAMAFDMSSGGSVRFRVVQLVLV
jgi:hypothetical protein